MWCVDDDDDAFSLMKKMTRVLACFPRSWSEFEIPFHRQARKMYPEIQAPW